ncbi:hypothetical protein T484DRAFT_1958214 [Baffinella frigidus]|nr:hypothetical protein T484DRAFT_1958214 [Cryptophyta sp. CCMP2293]
MCNTQDSRRRGPPPGSFQSGPRPRPAPAKAVLTPRDADARHAVLPRGVGGCR